MEARRLSRCRNIALKKLGRNIYNFGLVERWLKYIVSVSDVVTIQTTSGAMLDSNTQRRVNKAQRMMLGQLIGEVLTLWDPQFIPTQESQDLFDIRLKTSIRVEMHEEDYCRLKDAYQSMLVDRNDLAHCFSEQFVLHTVENCQNAIQYLDAMREKHLPTMHGLQAIVTTYLSTVKELRLSFE